MTLHPGNQYYPAAYWFWHTVPAPQQIREQVAQMAAAGFKTFLIQARLAFPRQEYLSEAYFQAYRLAMEEARRLGLTAGIYDDYNFISGHAGGKTVQGRDDLRERHLFWSSTRLQSGQGTCTVSRITSLMFAGFGEPAMQWLYEGGRPAWGKWEILAVLGRPVGKPLQDPAQILNLTDYARLHRADETGCEVAVALPDQLPEPLEVTAFVHAVCTSSRLINYLNQEAARHFLEVDYEPYRAHLGEYFGDPIQYVFFDHPYGGFYRWAEWHGNAANSLMYDERLPQAYASAYQESIFPALLSLVTSVGGRTAQLRCRFFDIYGRLGRGNFFGQVQRWAGQNGLGVAGHELLGYVGAWGPTEGFPDIDVRTNFGADYFDVERYRTVTTVDACNFHPQVSAKFGDSVARSQGRAGCLVEQYAVGTGGRDTAAGQWDVTLDAVRAQAFRHQLFGCRQFLFHGFYQTDGHGDSFEALRNPRFDFAPGINYEPWFADHPRFAAESAGLSAFFDGSEGDARIAVLYPRRTYWAEGSGHPFSEHCGFWFRALLEAGVPYDIVDERSLARASVDQGRLVLRSGSYRGLVLPGVSTIKSWRRFHVLEEFARAGGLIVASGPLLQASQETGRDERLQRSFQELASNLPSVRVFPDLPSEGDWKQIMALMDEHGCLPAVIEGAEATGTVWMRTGLRGQERLVTLFNDRPSPGQVHVRLPAAGKVVRYWPGEARETAWPWYRRGDGTTTVTVDLDPMELACLRLIETAEPEAHILACSVRVRDFQPGQGNRTRAWIAQAEPAPVVVLVEGKDAPEVQAGPAAQVHKTEDGAWRVTVEAPSMPAPVSLEDGWQFRTEGEAESKPVDIRQGWESQGDPDYSGVGVYECTFDLPAGHEAFAWALHFPGLVAAADLEVNGRPAGSCFAQPYRIEIPGGILTRGGNHLTVRVRNTAGNRYYHNTPFEGTAPTPSGIIGAPVLRPSVKIELEF